MRKNNFDVGDVGSGDGYCGGKRAKQMKRRIMKGFTIDTAEDMVKDVLAKQQHVEEQIDFFSVVADVIKNRRRTGREGDNENQDQDQKSKRTMRIHENVNSI